MTKRSLNLDIYRAFAVVLMVFFHFIYDLTFFNFLNLSMTQVAFWIYLRTFIVFLFMSAVGMSLYIVYSEGFHKKKYLKRLALLGLVSLGISLVSYFIFPESWIYFGVLHMIFFASLIGPFFVRIPNISALIGLLIISLYQFDFRMIYLLGFLQEPLHLPLYYTEDLAPFIPWFGPVLLGIFAMHHNLINKLTLKPSTLLLKFSWIGKHTLAIYIVHQGLLFAIIGSASYLFK